MQTTSDFAYAIYGLLLDSDLVLPQLHPPTGLETARITMRRSDDLPHALDEASQLGPYLWARPGLILLNIPGIVRATVSDGTRIRYAPVPGADDDTVRLFLLGSGIGALMMQRGALVIHGNAVELGGGCILCAGPSGAGKSTLAAGLMQRGHRIVADDVCPIDAEGTVIPGMPRIKLWQDAAEALGVATGSLIRVRPEYPKFHLPLEDAFCDQPRKVRAIYILTPRDDPGIRIDTVSGPAKFLALRENSYQRQFLDGMDLSQTHFRQIARLAARTPVKRVFRPMSGFELDRLIDAVIGDASRVP